MLVAASLTASAVHMPRHEQAPCTRPTLPSRLHIALHPLSPHALEGRDAIRLTAVLASGSTHTTGAWSNSDVDCVLGVSVELGRV